MNKFCLSLIVVLLASVSYAQVNNAVRGKTPNPKFSTEETNVTPFVNSSKVSIWSSDFSTVQDWTIGNSAGNIANWEISNAPSFWWSGNAPLASTSGGNAASFNSDSYAQAANQIENNAWIQSIPISCSNFATVAISFHQYFNKWSGRTFIQVSSDQGQTWTDYEVNGDLENNDETGNPALTMVDITASAAYQQEIIARFLYLSNAISDGGTDNTAGVAWDYGWIIDDVELAELPDDDIALTKAWHANIESGYEYSHIPLSQTREMRPGVVVQNQGALQQSLYVTATISNSTGIVSSTSENITLPYGTKDTLWFNTGYTPNVNDQYEVSFTIPADQDPTDDQVNAAPLIVTDNTMAHDYGNAASFGWNPSSTDQGTVDLANAPHSWGNIYFPEVDQEIFGVDVNFANGTSPGLLFSVRVQRFDSLGGIQGNLLLVTEYLYTVQSADIGTSITTITFPQPELLIGGSGYIIDVYKIDETSGEGFILGGSDSASEDDDNSTVGYGPYGQNSEIGYYLNWGFAPYIRANFNSILNTEEVVSSGISLFPNPSNGLINIMNPQNESSTVEVISIDGKFILSKEIDASSSIDLSSNSAGVYLVKVSTATGSITERIVIR
jgi:hypothetical protein